MLGFFSQATLLFVFLLGLAYVRLSRSISYSGGVPRIGKTGLLGYIQTSLRWTLDTETLILEGRAAFFGRPFVIPTFSGPLFFLGPAYLERLRAAPDSKFNAYQAIDEDLQLPYTMDKHQLTPSSYHPRVLRTDVNRAIPSYVPEILDESITAMKETFKSTESETTSVPVFDTMTHLIARISNRVIFGEALCRNKEFIHAVVHFSETVPVMAPFLQWSPPVIRPVVYFILALVMGGKKEPLKYLIPHLRRYIKDRETMAEKSILVSEFLIQNSPSDEPLEGIAVRLLNINFASIHTSAIFITQALFEMALLSAEQLNSMRLEIKEALKAENGWTKGALDKMYKVDSALREIGRYHGIVHSTLSRVAMHGCELDDGTHVPPGFRVAVDIRAIHFNPDVYQDPDRCDLFRFSKMRSQDGADSKYGFAMVDSNYLPFGAGRHACAGRFFAAMELKIMLAHILLEYDFGYPPGITQRPKNLIFNGAILPDPKTHLLFKVRTTKDL